jgi:hypothetical protein
LVGEGGEQEGAIAPDLLARRGLEALLEDLQRRGAGGAKILLRRAAARMDEFVDLARQAAAGSSP